MRASHDLRYAARTLLKNPGFTLAAVVALALGIGASAAIFSVVNSVLLRPLPYKDPNKLVTIFGTDGFRQSAISPADYVEWRDQNQVFDDITVYTGGSFNLAGGDQPARVNGIAVSATFFSVLGAEPWMGRGFFDEENQPGRNKVVVISHALWRGVFNSDPYVLGRTLKLDEEIYTLVGVMPEDFRFVMKADLITPLAIDQNYRANSFLRVIARLKSGVTREQAKVEKQVIAERLERENPLGGQFRRLGGDVVPLHELTAEKSRLALKVLFGAVGFVLLIACANLANMLLARGMARRKEIAVRAALGASRLHLIRQLLTESVLLGLAGGAAGLVLAVWGLDLLLGLAPPTLPRVNEIGIDTSVLAFTLVTSLVTAVLFGLLPALQASKLDLTEALKEGTRASRSGFVGVSLRNLLVVGQVALALVLLVGAGLMLNSFARLLNVNKGFDPENLLTLNVALPATYRTPDQIRRFYQESLQRIRSLPGVTTAGTVNQLPLGEMGLRGDFVIEGQLQSDDGYVAAKIIASADYFHTMRIPLLSGREFNDADTSAAKNVAIINETFARRFLPDDDPLGRRLSVDQDSNRQPIWREVVGVVRDVKQRGLAGETEPAIFAPYTQISRLFWLDFATFVVRTEGESDPLAGAVQREIQRVDPNLPAFGVMSMDQVISASVSDPRFNALLLAVFAGIALLLAAVGIYGVISYSVAQRTHEVGIRMAVGAAPLDIMRLVVGQGMVLALAGIFAGLILAFAVTRVIATFLFGVSATDWPTFTAISLLLAAVALGACFLPARRAMKVDPLVALRHE